MYGLWRAARAVVVFPIPPPPRIAILDDPSRSSIPTTLLSSWSRSMIRCGFGGSTWWALIWLQWASILVAFNNWRDTHERSRIDPSSGLFTAVDCSSLISIRMSCTRAEFDVKFWANSSIECGRTNQDYLAIEVVQNTIVPIQVIEATLDYFPKRTSWGMLLHGFVDASKCPTYAKQLEFQYLIWFVSY